MAVLRVGGIPADWACADLRDFFAPEIEREVFSCFHFVRAPDAHSSGSLCALAAMADADALRALIAKYAGRPWSESAAERVCRLEPCRALLAPASSARDGRADRFRTRAQRRERGAVREGGSPRASELCAPSWLPRGNVGSSAAELRAAVAHCRLSARDISQLGLEFALGSAALSRRGARSCLLYTSPSPRD